MRLSKWDGQFDRGIVDGLVNLIGRRRLRHAAPGCANVQTGYLRSYVLFLVLAAVGIFVVLSYFVTSSAGRGSVSGSRLASCGYCEPQLASELS